MTRKAVAFTLVSLLVATTILTITFIGDSTPADDYLQSLDIRRDTTDSTISSLNTFFSYHIQRVLNENLHTVAASVTGTGSLYNHTSLSGSTTAKTVVSNCFRHGRFTNPNGSTTTCYPLRNETRSLEVFAENYTQTDIDIAIEDTLIRQENAESITVTTTVSTDAHDFTADTYTSSKNEYAVSLEGTPDPLYRFHQNASERPYNPDIDFDVPIEGMSNASLDRAITNHWYFHWDKAPSYFQRLGNETSASSDCCGLASIVRPQNVSNPNNYSHLDYQYWNNECGTNTKRVTFDNVSINTQLRYDSDIGIEALQDVILPKDLLTAAGINDSSLWEDVNCTS